MSTDSTLKHNKVSHNKKSYSKNDTANSQILETSFEEKEKIRKEKERIAQENEEKEKLELERLEKQYKKNSTQNLSKISNRNINQDKKIISDEEIIIKQGPADYLNFLVNLLMSKGSEKTIF